MLLHGLANYPFVGLFSSQVALDARVRSMKTHFEETTNFICVLKNNIQNTTNLSIYKEV